MATINRTTRKRVYKPAQPQSYPSCLASRVSCSFGIIPHYYDECYGPKIQAATTTVPLPGKLSAGGFTGNLPYPDDLDMFCDKSRATCSLSPEELG